MTPPAAQGVQASRNPRVIAKAFLAEEADLLGLTPISEMREVEMKEDVVNHPSFEPDESGTRVGLGYDHYLNGLKLSGAGVGISVGPTGKILYVYADVVDITPALLEAVKQPGLPQMEIRRVIKKDLIANGEYPNKVDVLKDEKYAIPMPPYVVWSASVGGEVSLNYLIDAFTGQIIRKVDAMICDPGPCTPRN